MDYLYSLLYVIVTLCVIYGVEWLILRKQKEGTKTFYKRKMWFNSFWLLFFPYAATSHAVGHRLWPFIMCCFVWVISIYNQYNFYKKYSTAEIK